MKYRILAIGLVLSLSSLLSGCSSNEAEIVESRTQVQMENGLFSWSDDVLEEEEAVQLFRVMEECGLEDLYQHFSSDISNEEIENFLECADEYGVSVYYLTGNPEWGLNPKGEEMCEEVEKVAQFNAGTEGKKLAGIIIDSEPYLLDAWDENENGVMNSYVLAMEQAHEKAMEAEIPLIACIPFYHDSSVHEEALKELMADGCDGSAIMNYSRKDEIEHVETEISIAEEVDCAVVVIYELQEAGKHGLKENNTYYQEGMEALQESISKFQDTFGKENFRYALHDYDALVEVIENE